MVLAINEGTNILQAVILVLIVMIIIIVVALVRTYALKAQDRAIRAEESLRYYMLTGEVARSAHSVWGKLSRYGLLGTVSLQIYVKKQLPKG